MKPVIPASPLRLSAGLDALLAQVPAGLPSCAVVDLDAIAENAAVLRDVADGAAVMAVVKADGYGHGMVPAARAALGGGATWLGVAFLREALALRAAGVDAPVLAWITVPGDRFGEAVAAGIDIGVGAGWALDEIAAAVLSGATSGRTARVHLKVDTGLGRGGATTADWPGLVAQALRLQADGVLAVVGLFSHLACSDEPTHPSVNAQVQAFTEAVALGRRAGADPEVTHLANSAGLLATPQTRFDLVRPGIALYGVSPMPDLHDPHDLGLRAAMTVVGRLAGVKDVAASQGVSYGLTYTTSGATTLGLVPLGYGDGLPRHASGTGPFLVAGHRRSVAGRVCMDQVVLDLDGDRPEPGEFAVMFGDGRHGEPTAQDWALAAGTIGYEIVTRVGARVPRVYLDAAAGGDGGRDG